MPKNVRVFDGNKRFNVYKGTTVVYTGNSVFIASLYRLLSKYDRDYYVGDIKWLKSRKASPTRTTECIQHSAA